MGGTSGRKAQPLLEGLWGAGKLIKPFCSSFRSIERQANILELPCLISPLPPLRNVPGVLGAVPAGMGVNKSADPFQILCF
jgi:hypothetical protein